LYLRGLLLKGGSGREGMGKGSDGKGRGDEGEGGREEEGGRERTEFISRILLFEPWHFGSPDTISTSRTLRVYMGMCICSLAVA